MIQSKAIHWFALVAVLAIALSGCFGGSSTTMPDDGMTDDGTTDDDGMTDDGTTDDDGMTDDGTTDAGLEIPAGLFASSQEAQYADDATDTLESMTGTDFAPLSSFTFRDFAEDGASLPEDDDTYIESVTMNEMGGVSVAFVIDGEMTTIEFTADDFHDYDSPQMEGHRNYATGPWTFSSSSPLRRQYFNTYSWSAWSFSTHDSYDGNFVYGVRTRPENLMSLGSASYQGYMSGNVINNDGNPPNWESHRQQIWGELALEADFDAGEIEGQVDELWIQSSSETGREWYELSDTNSVAVTDGVIDEGRFTADWTGQDSNPDSSALESVRGFVGSLFGEFYGPNGEEVGGVLNGHRDATDTTPEQVVSGTFGAERE